MALKNLYLFYGDDSYSAFHKAKHWQQEFEKKYGDLNLQIFEGEKMTGSNFSEAVETMPFLADKKLIIIRDFLLDGEDEEQKKVAEKLETVADYCIVIFIEKDKPDARTTLFKKLSKTAQVIEFNELDKSKLLAWIEQEFSKKNVKIGHHEADVLAENIGPNLWQMSQEIDKLSLYSAEKPLNEEAIHAIISPNISSSVFKLTDHIAAKNAKLSLKTLDVLLTSGEDLMQIFFMMVRHFRILLEVQACVQNKLSPQQMIQKLKEHPFVINNTLKQSKNFSLPQIKNIYRQFLQIDLDTKNGTIKMTTTDNTELRLALEKLIIELCR